MNLSGKNVADTTKIAIIPQIIKIIYTNMFLRMNTLYSLMLQQYFLILKSDNSKYNYLLKSHNITYYKYYNLISYFDSFDYTKPLIILVPSIFNSPEIWFLPNNDTIVQNILAHCNLYLIEWKQIEQGN